MDHTPGADAPEIPSTLTGRLPATRSKPTLPDEVKEFIVRGLACYQTPMDLVDAVHATFGIEISRQRVHRYNPEGAVPPAPRWRDLHAAARRAFLDEVADIGITHKSVRLRLMDRLTHDAMEGRHTERVLALLDRAAKECAGYYDPTPPTEHAPRAPKPMRGPRAPRAPRSRDAL